MRNKYKNINYAKILTFLGGAVIILFVAIAGISGLYDLYTFETTKLRIKETPTSSKYAYKLTNKNSNFEMIMFADRERKSKGFAMTDKNGVNFQIEYVHKDTANKNVLGASTNNQFLPAVNTGKNGEGVVTYKDVRTEQDLRYTVTNSQIKEEIIINTKSAAENTDNYTFNLNIEGLSYEKNENNEVIPTFTSIKDKETTYTIPPAFMIDSKGSKSYGVTTKIKEDESNPNNLIITLTPNKTWLTSDNRQFPIVIDPTLIKGNPPILSLNFDEGNGGTAYDGSTNNFDGTITAATWTQDEMCVSGKCLKYDGTNDYVTFTDHANLDIGDSTNLTISAWVKLNTVGSTQTVVGKKTSTAATDAGYILTYNSSSNIFELRVADGTDQFIINSKVITDTSKWIHIEAVYDDSSSTNSQIYINGQEAKASTTGNIANVNSLANSIDLIIGTQGNGNSDLNGFVDSVKIYNYAKTSTQVRQDYAAKGAVMGVSAQFGPDKNRQLSDGLVGYWKMDEKSANTCTGAVNDNCDASGMGRDGSWVDNATTSSGKYGASVTLDGTGDYVDLGDNAEHDLIFPFTISSWINIGTLPSVKGTDSEIISKYGGSGLRQWTLSIGTDNAMYFFKSHNGTNGEYGSVTGYTFTSNDLNIWRHVVYSVDKEGKAYMYVDGDLKETYTFTDKSIYTSGSVNAHIGSRATNANYFLGKIDETRLYNRSLSDGEVKNLYSYAPGPVAYYKFDEKTGTTAYDSSGNANTASFVNTPAWTFGKYGSALSFDGSSTYLTVADSATVDFGTNSFTASAWIKYNGTASSQDFILHKWESGVAGGYALNMQSDGTLRFGIEDDGSSFPEDSAESTIAYDDGEWHYVTGVKTGTSKIELYVDGVLVGSDLTLSANLTLDSASLLYLGSRYSASQQWYGEIDEIKLYNYARTPGQIIEDMNGGHPVGGSPVGSQIAYWKFDDGYGDTAYDWSSQGTNGNLAGSGGSCPGAANCPTWSLSGKFGGALSFDGSNDFVDVGDVIDTSGNTPMTLSAWINVNALPGTDGKIISKYNDGVGGEWYLSVNSNGTVGFLRECGSYGTASTAVLSTGSWYHVAGVYDGTYLKIYINGKLDKSASDSCSTTDTTADVYIGADDHTTSSQRNLNAIIDEVKVYTASLTQEQIQTEYLGGVSTKFGSKSTTSTGISDDSATREFCVPGDSTSCDPPLAVYKLDENTSTVANNSAGGTYTGTLTNGPEWTIGKFGKGVNFTGSDDYITTGNIFNPTSAFTISMWAYLRTTGTDDTLFSSSTGDTSLFAMYIPDGASNNLRYCNDGATCTAVATSNNSVLTDNAWQHITFSYNGSGTAQFYVNGINVTSDSTAGEASDTGNKIFGNFDTDTTNAIDGILDEIHVYNYVRTPAQIAWEYNRGAPAAHYKFDECTGSTIQDWSPNANGGYNNNDGTVNFGGSPTVGDCSTSSTSWFNGAEGKINASMSFDGSDDEVIITDTTNSVFDFPSGQEMTVSAWINPSNLPGGGSYASIFSKSGTNGNGYYAQITSLGGLEFCIFNTGGGGCYTTSRTPVVASAWQHLTYSITVGNASTMRIYYNGQLLSGSWDNDGSTVPVADNATVNIGSSGSGSEPFNGRIDDLRLYRYTLNQNQINTIMNDNSVVRFK